MSVSVSDSASSSAATTIVAVTAVAEKAVAPPLATALARPWATPVLPSQARSVICAVSPWAWSGR